MAAQEQLLVLEIQRLQHEGLLTENLDGFYREGGMPQVRHELHLFLHNSRLLINRIRKTATFNVHIREYPNNEMYVQLEYEAYSVNHSAFRVGAREMARCSAMLLRACKEAGREHKLFVISNRLEVAFRTLEDRLAPIISQMLNADAAAAAAATVAAADAATVAAADRPVRVRISEPPVGGRIAESASPVADEEAFFTPVREFSVIPSSPTEEDSS